MNADDVEYDLDLLTSLFDDEMEMDDKISAQPLEKPLPNKNGLTDSSKVLEVKASDEELEHELKVLEERMTTLRKQLQQKKESSLTKSTMVPSNNPENGRILKTFDINAKLFGNTTKARTEPGKSNTQNGRREAAICTGDDSSEEEGNPLGNKYNEFGQFVRKRLAHTSSYEDDRKMDEKPWAKKSMSVPIKSPKLTNPTTVTKKRELQDNTTLKDEKFETDPYSGIRIIKPVVSSLEMQTRMLGRRMIRMSCIRLQMRGGDIEGDWVTIGVLVNKSNPKKSSKGNSFSIWKLTDLRDCDKTVTLFLFGKTHTEHWKSSVGSVFGILNPTIMPNRDSMEKKNANELCLTVDNPQKIMLMGTSKDYGTCRGRRKDGDPCSMVVNKAVCEFCSFHVQREYRKTSSKRMDLQASYSSHEPRGLREKYLRKQQIMYGGQMYVSPGPSNGRTGRTSTGTSKTKDRLTLESLKLQTKAAELLKTEKAALLAAQDSAKEIDGTKRRTDQTLNKSAERVPIRSITTKELVKLQAGLNDEKVNGRMQPTTILQNQDILNTTPKLGKGLGPGGYIDLQFDFKSNGVDSSKVKAIQKIRMKGPLKRDDPNGIKKNRTSPEFQEKVKKRLATDLELEEPDAKRSKSDVDVTSKEFLDILNKKSKYENLVDDEQLRREEKYFDELEKKEQLETKMSTTMEVPCRAVSCKKCKYTAFAALDTCRTENHPLLVHNAVKRFFKCKDCQRRTVSVSKLPTKPCGGCGGTCYERVAMWKERAGPKLSSEQLSLRGNEQKFLSGMISSSNLNL